MSQKFTDELLLECNMTSCKPASTPLPQHLKLSPNDGAPIDDSTYYRTVLGKLNYLTNTRPDLSSVVQLLSQFMQLPCTAHLDALHHLLRYVKATSGQGILLKASDQLSLHAFSDSDWGSCPFSRKSVTGYVVLFGGSPISWKSKKQSTISKSSS